MSGDDAEPISGGGLLYLISLMEATVALKGDQGSDTAEEAEAFARPLYETIDALVASEVSWKEVPGDQER